MLTISKPLSSGQAQTYHAKEFTSAEQNYWRQGDSILDEWQGKMAECYGLAGAIDAQHFARLSDGQNPVTGEQLVRHRSGQAYRTEDGATVKPVEHRAGWDATFSTPKSVSLTALVGGDKRVREAHRQAVTTALTELERYTEARIGGNHAAETTGKFIAAKFEHDTARPVDGYAAPRLHTHAVIFNMTERGDGSTRAIQPKSYFDSQQFATAVYQTELTYQLRNLGYQIEAGKSGAPEIKGYSKEYLDASSPRRQQIEEAMAKSGFSGPEAAQIAAHNTRDKKLTPLYAALPEGHPAVQKEHIALQDLAKDEWILFTRRVHPVIHDAIMDAARRPGIAPKHSHDTITSQEAIHLVSEHVGVAILTKPAALGFPAKGIAIRPLSDTSLCFQTCVIMRKDDDSRLANVFVRSFLRKYAYQRRPPTQTEISPSSRVVSMKKATRAQ